MRSDYLLSGAPFELSLSNKVKEEFTVCYADGSFSLQAMLEPIVEEVFRMMLMNTYPLYLKMKPADLAGELDAAGNLKSGSGFNLDDGSMSEGRELDESFVTKLKFLKFHFLALAGQIVLISLIGNLYTTTGITIGLGGSVFQGVVPVFLTIIMHISHIFTDYAINNGLSAYFGQQLASSKGFSLAIVGFVQGSVLQRCNLYCINNSAILLYFKL
jgi:hypothetical protein